MDVVRVVDSFGWLSNLYIIDYFVDNHWNLLPASWREYFDALIAKSELLTLIEALLDKACTKKWPRCEVSTPLSLMALRIFVCTRLRQQHHYVQSPAEIASIFRLQPNKMPNDFTTVKSLDTLIRTKIKEKKLYEIERIYELVRILLEYCKQNGSSPSTVVDVGSGLGHLTRILSAQLDCQVKTIEGNDKLVSRASTIDNRIDVRKQTSWKKPIHKAAHINEVGQIDCPDENTLLIGLHACGDLSSLIIKNFVQNSNSIALINFGCCYHKLNGGSDKLFGHGTTKIKTFPMSQKYKKLKLSYTTRELACHANEQFLEQLRSTSTVDTYMLKSSYRALLEWLIVEYHPNSRRHQRFSSVKNAEQLDFWTYAKNATVKDLELNAEIVEMEKDTSIQELAKQKLVDSADKIPIIYALRKMIAPLIERLILEDRRSFLQENNCQVHLIPLFDPQISPRNIALISTKKINN